MPDFKSYAQEEDCNFLPKINFIELNGAAHRMYSGNNSSSHLNF